LQKLLIRYTCKPCGEVNQGFIGKESYLHGVVICTCKKCNNKHLIADHLNWFQEKGKTIEEILALKGETVKKFMFDSSSIQSILPPEMYLSKQELLENGAVPPAAVKEVKELIQKEASGRTPSPLPKGYLPQIKRYAHIIPSEDGPPPHLSPIGPVTDLHVTKIVFTEGGNDIKDVTKEVGMAQPSPDRVNDYESDTEDQNKSSTKTGGDRRKSWGHKGDRDSSSYNKRQ